MAFYCLLMRFTFGMSILISELPTGLREVSQCNAWRRSLLGEVPTSAFTLWFAKIF